MRFLLFLACASLAVCIEGVGQVPLPNHSIIELRIARTSRAPGYAQSHSVADTTFFVNDTVLVSDSEIEDARGERTEDGAGRTLLVTNLRLTAQAAGRVAKSTRSHVGDRLAIFLDKQLVGAPPIIGEVGGDAHLQIDVGPPAPLDRIAAAVAARWQHHH